MVQITIIKKTIPRIKVYPHLETFENSGNIKFVGGLCGNWKRRNTDVIPCNVYYRKRNDDVVCANTSAQANHPMFESALRDYWR
jgi:hypothetical protein